MQPYATNHSLTHIGTGAKLPLEYLALGSAKNPKRTDMKKKTTKRIKHLIGHLYPKGAMGTWQFDYLDSEGKRKRISTGETNLIEAKEFAGLLTVAHGLSPNVRRSQVKKILEASQNTNDTPALEFFTFYHQTYINKTPRDAKSGFARMKIVLSFLLEKFKEIKVDLSEIDTDYALAILMDLKKDRSGTRELAHGTLKNYKNCLSKIFNDARKKRLIDYNPFTDVKIPRYTVAHLEDYKRRAFDSGELKKLFAVMPEDFCDLVSVGLYTGFRCADIIHLKRGDIQFSRPSEIKITMRKTGRPIQMPMHPQLIKVLEKFNTLHRNDHIFPAFLEIYRKDDAVEKISKEFKHQMFRAGIYTPGLCFHCLRRNFVTQLRHNTGISKTMALQLAGHCSVEVNDIYNDDFSDKELQIAINSINYGDEDSGLYVLPKEPDKSDQEENKSPKNNRRVKKD